MSKADLHLLTAVQAVGAIRAGRLSSEALVAACLERVAATDGGIGAWTHVDADGSIVQAREADRIRKAGRATGALHGVPVGVKDIVDVAGLPCERGTPVHAGRVPDKDAAVVDRLREAGAVILGKTVTTELAFVAESGTRNPHDPARTPGGSSSGSAAAVAACHVPLAIGTQTGGSVIRPASFCGIYGIKPTRGMISRRGVLQTSAALDQVGTMARTLEDAALLADVIAGYDPADPASFARPRPSLAAGAAADPPVEPALAWFDLAYNDRIDADAREGFDELMAALGERVERLDAAANLSVLPDVQTIIHEFEFVRHLAGVIETGLARLTPALQDVVAHGQTITDEQYREACEVKASAEAFFAEFFADYDAILMAGATGEAPPRGGGTGDAVFCKMASLAGLPAVTLPLLVGANGLPVGVQLVGAVEQDDRLMRTASWLQKTLAAEQ